MQKIKSYITYIIFATFPIMSIVNIVSNAKFNLALSDFAVLLLGLVWLVDIKKFSLKKNYPYWWYFTGLILIGIISGIYNLNSDTASAGVIGIVSEMVKFAISAVYLFVGYNAFKDKEELFKVLLSWLIGLWIFMLYGLYTNISAINGLAYWSFNNTFGHSRFLGTVTDANLAGTYLTFSFFIVLIFIKLSKFKFTKILGYFTEIMVIVCILLTQSRGTWVGFAVGIVFFILYNFKKLYKYVLFLIPVLLIIFFGFENIDYETNNQISNSIETRIEEAISGEGQFVIRSTLTLSALNMGLDNPIIGVGRGNFTLNSKPYVDKFYKGNDTSIYNEIRRVIPHTTFIGMFAELGLAGFICFSSLFVILFLKIVNNRNYINMQALFLLIAFGVQSLVLNLENFRGLWLFIGIMLLIQDKEIEVKEYKTRENVKLVTGRGFIIAMAVAFVFFAMAAYKIPNVVGLEEMTEHIYELELQKDAEVLYFINGEVIVEVYDKDKNLKVNKAYYNSDGYGIINLDGNNSYKIVFKGNDATLKDLYYISDEKIHSLIGYKYLPSFIDGKHKEYVVKNGENAQYPLRMEGFTILKTRIDNSNGSSKLEIDLQLDRDIKSDIAIDVVYSSDNIENFPDGKNKKVYRYYLKSIFNEKNIGDIQTIAIDFKGENTEYNVNLKVKDKEFYLGKAIPDSMSLVKYLESLDDNKLMILAIMDEGTVSLNYESIFELKKFNLEADLKGKSRYAYIAVGSKNSLVQQYEALSDKALEANFSKGYMLGDYELPFDMKIKSAGFTEGNIASIIIDGIEYSQIRRGMNIVIYDMEINQVIDSINFDTYSSIYK